MIKKIILVLLYPTILLAQGTVDNASFFSDVLGENRYVDVYLPQSYDPSGSVDYPVIYFLHGGGGDNNSYPYLINILDDLIGNDIIQPVIVAKPDGDCGPYIGSFYVNSALYGDFEDYIAFDVVQFIDSNYKTIPDREKRCLMGHSMGGYGSAMLAMKHSDIFKGFASHGGSLEYFSIMNFWRPVILAENGGAPPYHYSPYVGAFSFIAFTLAGAFTPNLNNPPYWVDFPLDLNGDIIDSVMTRFIPFNPPYLARQLPPNTDLAIYFDCGTNDEYYLYPGNAALADTLHSLGIIHTFESYQGDHSNMLEERFPIALEFLDSVMNAATGITGSSTIPASFVLNQNYPNPFNASTNISFEAVKPGNLKLAVYDLLGKEIVILLDGYYRAGRYMIDFDASDLSSGVYFYRLRAGDVIETRRMVLLK
jgi:enterochelin esterase-like enzyme